MVLLSLTRDVRGDMDSEVTEFEVDVGGNENFLSGIILNGMNFEINF